MHLFHSWKPIAEVNFLLKSLIFAGLLLPTVLTGESKVELILDNGSAFAVYPPIHISSDTLYLAANPQLPINTLDFKIFNEPNFPYPPAMTGENPRDNYPTAFSFITLNEIIMLRVVDDKPRIKTYLGGIIFGLVVGSSMHSVMSESMIQEVNDFNLAFMSAAGLLSGFLIGDYIDKKDRRVHSELIDLQGNTPEEKVIILSDVIESKLN